MLSRSLFRAPRPTDAREHTLVSSRDYWQRSRMSEKELTLVPRPVRDSQSEMAEIVLPNDANPLNALLGGRLMHWMDLAGALAAHRHSRNYVLTASIDHLDFLFPVHVGDLVILRSSVNCVFRSYIDVCFTA